MFKPYVDVVTRLNETTFDVVFIDGRARVACALKVLPYLSPTSTVILHDARRDYYAHILEYYDEVGRVVGDRGARLFRRKPSVVGLLPLSDATIHAAYAKAPAPAVRAPAVAPAAPVAAPPSPAAPVVGAAPTPPAAAVAGVRRRV